MPRFPRRIHSIGRPRRIAGLVLLGAALVALLASAAGAAAPAAVKVFREPGFTSAATGAVPLFVIDPKAAAEFRAGDGGRLRIPDRRGEIELALRRVDPFAPGATVTSTGASGARSVTVDAALFRGEIAGIPGSSAVLTISPRGILGVVSWPDRTIGIAPAPASGRPGAHAIGDVGAPARDFRCAADDLIETARRPGGAIESLRDRERVAPETKGRLWCDLAIDCDWEYYANKHGANLGAALDYAVALTGVVSSIYESEVDVSVRLSHLNVWTTSSDPYSAANTNAQIYEFQNYWQSVHGDVSRHAAHLLSGRAIGGGIAFLSVLCDRGMAYGVSQVDGTYSYPTSATTWDAYVLAHELGHNFSSPHTHSCFWGLNGYAPPGAILDSCWTSEGGCYTGPTGMVPPGGGTIMSYCHLAGPIQSTIRLQFHTACRSVIRAHAETCLPAGAFDPKVNLVAVASGLDVSLDWSPSPASGVIRYDVYRSGSSLDLHPMLAGSTTDTAWVDHGRVGVYFYRVRAVRASDESAFGNEARVAACVESGPGWYESGPASHSPVAADLDEDGILDLVLVNNIPAGTATVVRGAGAGGVGDGTFLAPAAFDAGPKPAGVAVADFDENGILDLAVTNNSASGTYSILLGQGTGGAWNGSFAAPVSYPVGSLPLAILARDFDENGIPDLAIACSGASTVAIALGQGSGGVGNGTFAPASQLVVGSGPVAIETGDFDEDGILDLAIVRNTTGSVSIFHGNGAGGRGNGTFRAGPSYSAGSGAAAIATGDWNEDGITDLAVARRESHGSVSVLLGAGAGGIGDGTFLPRIEYACAGMPSSIVPADLNGDGITDLALATAESPGNSVTLFGIGAAGVGDGTFEPGLARTVGSLPSALVASDFDENGVPDLAITHTASSLNLGVLAGECSGGLDGSIAVVAPNGGESWAASTEHTIVWTRGPAVQAVTIEVSRDAGATWERIAENVTGTAYPWTATDPAAPNAIVRVSDSVAPTRADASDAPFAIAPDPLLDAGAPAAPALAIERVFPNPAREALSVSFALPRPGAARLELLDVAGRRVLEREVGGLGAGRHIVALLEGGRLAGGLYFVRLTHEGESRVMRAAILR